MNKKTIYLSVCLILFSSTIFSQSIPSETCTKIGNYLTTFSQEYVTVGSIKIDSSYINNHKKMVELYASVNCSYIPFRQKNVTELYSNVRKLLPTEYDRYKVVIYTDHQPIDQLISPSANKAHFVNKFDEPLVSNITTKNIPTKGLLNRHIAMWPSHGFYYDQGQARWQWQRARMFQTVEDLYPEGYVLPYLIPMLENAGANVMIPRERDYQRNEVIVDNDSNEGGSAYNEIGVWATGNGSGFAHIRKQYLDGQNPFQDGTFRQTKTTKKGHVKMAEWTPDIPKCGNYAVYVAYKTVKNSTKDALYTVYHNGGITQFRVNQTMGGGTWIYLGTFNFTKGISDKDKITLSNQSKKTGDIVTADAVKIGGGMGNIARTIGQDQIAAQEKSGDSLISSIKYAPEVSGYPRFAEGARYWMQWAGAPDSIYTKSRGKNDYTDDYQGRGYWVNWLSGGSSTCPKTAGLHIPIDLSLAFHTDAGTFDGDTIVGTLGIFHAPKDSKFENNVPRNISHTLTDIVQTQIVKDIRAQYEPNWTRRGMWNKSYSESTSPNVPSMLLELLSHENFADMRYGLDPRFQFTVSRAIYKGMLQYLSTQYDQPYVVEPLPVEDMSLSFVSPNEVQLSWKAVVDSLEETATPAKYIVYTRIGDDDFDNGIVVDKPSCKLLQQVGKIYSYKVTAINAGGESFPSEILSACRVNHEKGIVLVINGFDRISGPDNFQSCERAGFESAKDHGVSYKYAGNYIGDQYEFRRNLPWRDNNASGFGASYTNSEGKLVAGNSFDYPKIHGKAIINAGYSFVSCSVKSISDGDYDLAKYKVVDLILGKQKQTIIGRGVHPAQFKTFDKPLQEKITTYCNKGGNIFVSGAYVGSDLWDTPNPQKTDIDFAENVLKYKWLSGQIAIEGNVKRTPSPFGFDSDLSFQQQLNDSIYAVESPDAIRPSGKDSYTIFRYSENNISAGIASDGKYKTCILGFPFETIKTSEQQNKLMKEILSFFNK